MAEAAGHGDAPVQRAPGLFPLSKDAAAAVGVLLFCAVAFAITLTFERAPASLAEGLQPATFPRLVLVIMTLLALLVLRDGLRSDERARPIRPLVLASYGMMVGFVLAFSWLGIVPAMVLACAGIPLLWGERRFKVIIPFALAVPAVIYLVFVTLLGVYFAPSPLWPF